MNETLIPHRTYKVRLFAMIFQEKEKLLELYNAVNGTNYRDPDKLTINNTGECYLYVDAE